eukprot:TRINITY_DN32034_c0_g1_i1.p1 TRINITY_DN32034_c0_g1~~TRINITY_DN32034_c0_g1_i1.p1  ORF type:complete len:146 (+),score=11.91 TRINITY_DN32034_c0_g1_i1:274-711(+)
MKQDARVIVCDLPWSSQPEIPEDDSVYQSLTRFLASSICCIGIVRGFMSSWPPAVPLLSQHSQDHGCIQPRAYCTRLQKNARSAHPSILQALRNAIRIIALMKELQTQSYDLGCFKRIQCVQLKKRFVSAALTYGVVPLVTISCS